MEALFLKLLNMSITAGWIVLAVVLLRLLLRKAPKWISCLLWVLVGLRLVLPFSFESKVSVVPSTETVSPEIVYSQTPTIDTGVPVVNNTVNPVISESFAPDPRTSVNPIQIVIFIATIVWCIGMTGMLIYSLVSYLRVRHKVRASINVRENIYICDDINTPFILGLIKPRIYLPSALREKEAEYVIAHEKSHLRRHDHLWKPLGFLLLTVYWFNPLLWLSYVLLCRDIELACDERVIKNMDTEEKKAYSTALLDCSIPRRMISACPLAFGEVNVKNRIKNVLNYKKPAFWIIVIAVIVCIVAAVCLLTDPMTDKEDETSRVSSSDIADMNIGAEMPHIEYADDERFVFSGAFGVLVYNYKECVVEKRISYEILNEHGIEILNAAVSSDGKAIYFANFDEEFSCKFDMETDDLTQLDGDISEIEFFVPEQSTDEQRALHNPFYLNSDDVYNTDRCFYYLRADTDWSMKSLQLVVHYYEFGHDAYWCIFPELQSEAEIKAIYYYRESVDFTEPKLILTPEDGRFEFIYSALSSYIGWGKYGMTEDTLTLKTDDGLYTYVFDVTDEGFRFDAERSSRIPEYRYSADSYETQCPVPDGAVFEGDVTTAEYIPTQPITLSQTRLANTSEWKTSGLESAGLGEAEISNPIEGCSFGTIYFLTVNTMSDVYTDLFIALERKEDVLLYPVSELCSLKLFHFADVDGEQGDEIIITVSNSGGSGLFTSYVLKVGNNGFTLLFDDLNIGDYFDTGFTYTLQFPFELLVKNNITGYSTVIDLSDREDYIDEVFDERGNPLGKWEAHHDFSLQFIPEDVDGDGVCEIIGTMYTYLFSHADGIGDSEYTLKFNKESGEFEVINARFIKYSDRKIIASGDYYTVTDMGDYTYMYDIVNRSGTTLLSDYGLTKEPKIRMVSDSVLCMYIQYGTGLLTRETVYVNVKTDEISPTYVAAYGEYGNNVLYLTHEKGYHSLVVCDFFDKEKFYKEVFLTDDKNIHFENIVDWEISPDGIATVTFVADSDYNEKTIEIDMTKE